MTTEEASPKPAVCCPHRVNQHSAAVGCIECKCRYRLAADGQGTFDPWGKYAAENQAPQNEPEVLCCPECEKPNQFGEMCQGCAGEFRRCEMAEEKFNKEHGLYQHGEAEVA